MKFISSKKTAKHAIFLLSFREEKGLSVIIEEKESFEVMEKYSFKRKKKLSSRIFQQIFLGIFLQANEETPFAF